MASINVTISLFLRRLKTRTYLLSLRGISLRYRPTAYIREMSTIFTCSITVSDGLRDRIRKLRASP